VLTFNEFFIFDKPLQGLTRDSLKRVFAFLINTSRSVQFEPMAQPITLIPLSLGVYFAVDILQAASANALREYYLSDVPRSAWRVDLGKGSLGALAIEYAINIDRWRISSSRLVGKPLLYKCRNPIKRYVISSFVLIKISKIARRKVPSGIVIEDFEEAKSLSRSSGGEVRSIHDPLLYHKCP
jgi:hypothetical protein